MDLTKWMKLYLLGGSCYLIHRHGCPYSSVTLKQLCNEWCLPCNFFKFQSCHLQLWGRWCFTCLHSVKEGAQAWFQMSDSGIIFFIKHFLEESVMVLLCFTTIRYINPVSLGKLLSSYWFCCEHQHVLTFTLVNSFQRHYKSWCLLKHAC